MLQKVKDIYSESIQIQISASSLLSENIATAAQMVMQCLLSGNKVIACGVSRSYANAQFLVSICLIAMILSALVCLLYCLALKVRSVLHWFLINQPINFININLTLSLSLAIYCSPLPL